MHRALLIDEILRLIFDFCAALPNSDSRWTFCQLARCCKAWKDPAIDRVWSRIDGAAPLVSLLPCDKDEELDVSQIPAEFWAYANRVKEASYHKFVEVPALDSLPMLMPKLEKVSLSFHGCMVSNAWMVSPRLKRITVNVGYAYDPQTTIDRSNGVADYLERVRACAPCLRSLQIRGRMTDSLNNVVASLTQLTDLTIHANHFLTSATLAAIVTFPRLRTLAVHASSIPHAEFADALGRSSAPCFPALEELEIRASADLLAAVLESLPVGILTRLHAEVDRCSRGPSHLKGTLEVLAQKTAKSLTELHIEDLTEYENLDSSLRSQASLEWYPLSLLSPLAALKDLKRFALVSTLPPDLLDTDLGQMGKWWPRLEHLNLGTFDADYLPADWQAKMTPASFGVVAKYLPRLERLALPILPIDLVASLTEQATLDTLVPRHEVLRTLAIGDVPDASACASTLVRAIMARFPSLTTLDCPAREVTDAFTALSGQARCECFEH